MLEVGDKVKVLTIDQLREIGNNIHPDRIIIDGLSWGPSMNKAAGNIHTVTGIFVRDKDMDVRGTNHDPSYYEFTLDIEGRGGWQPHFNESMVDMDYNSTEIDFDFDAVFGEMFE